MAQEQTIEIKVQLRDEISRAAEQAVAKLLRLNQVDTSRSTSAMDKLGRAAAFAGREIRAISTITGVGGILGAGGIVAGLVAAKRSLDEFAQSGMRMHFTARELRVSEGFLRDYTDALKAVGQSEGEAASGIQSGLRTLEEAWTEGKGSRMFKELEKGVGDSGTRLFRDLMQSYGRDGPEKALQLALDRMERMNPRAQAAFMKTMGFGTVGATELRKILPQLVPVIRMSKDEMLRYNVANINLERTWGNIKTTVGNALLPAFTELTKAVDEYLRTPAGKQFLEDIKRWATSMAEYVRSQGFADRMKAITEGSEKLVTDLGAAFAAADKVVQDMGASWVGIFEALAATKIITWLFGFGNALRFIAPMAGVIAALTWILRDPEGAAKKFKEFRDFNRKSLEELKKERPQDPRDLFQTEGPAGGVGTILQLFWDLFKGNIDLFPEKKRTGALAPAGEEKGTIEKLAEAAQVRSATGGLKDKLANLDDELAQLTGFLMIGGPDGTAGSSGYGAGLGGELSRGAYDTMFKRGPMAGQYDAIVAAAARQDISPSLLAGIMALESKAPQGGPFGMSRATTTFLNPGGLMGGGRGNRTFMNFPSIEAGIDKTAAVVAKNLQAGGGTFEGLAEKYSPSKNPKTGLPYPNDPHGTNRLWPSLVSKFTSQLTDRGFDPGGLQDAVPYTGGSASTFDDRFGTWNDATLRLNHNIARADGAYKGSGEVDIDISNVAASPDASNPSTLFRPLIQEKTPQMAASGNDRSVPSYFNQA